MMLVAKFARAIDVGFDGADDLQPIVAACGFDDIAAPAAEADDGGRDHREASGEGCRRIASMIAELSLSGPSSAIAERSRSACASVTGKAQSALPRFVQDQLGILQGLRDVRLRPKIPAQHFLTLGVHDARIRRGLSRRCQEGASIQPQPLRKHNALGQRRPVVLQDQIDRKLGPAGIADLADADAARAEHGQQRVECLDRIRFRRRPARWRVPSLTSALVPEIGASMKAKPASAARAAIRSISSGAQVVVQIMVGRAELLFDIVEQRFDLRAVIHRDDDRVRPDWRDRSPTDGCNPIAPELLAPDRIDIEADHGDAGADQSLRQRRAHQTEPDDSNRRVAVAFYFASMPAALAASVHRVISLLMKRPNSAGGIVETIMPRLASFSRVAGADRIFSLSV